MKSFWSLYSRDAGVEEMMLDTTASQLSSEEMPEVLSLLPECKGKRILELAGGIGRFTGILAQQAAHVTTVDFIEEFIEKNKENNNKHDNIEYISDDVMNLSFQEKSFDLVFSNWLLMYLTVDDIAVLKQRILTWLNDGGYFFFRESCRKGGGNFDLELNPTFYRSPQHYNAMFLQESTNKHNPGDFKLIMTRSLQCYVKAKGNRNQICWLLEKCNEDYGKEISINHTKTLRRKLEAKHTIFQMEKILGGNYVAILGCYFIEDQFKMLNLQPEQSVLDICCGTGSQDFILEEEYSVDVMGIDSSRGMIEFAWERKSKLDRDVKICFEIDDVTTRAYPPESVDVIYSRGRQTLNFTIDQSLLMKIMNWLKPGGKLLVYELCRGIPHLSKEEDKSASNEDDHDNEDVPQYSTEEYLEILKLSGFIEVKTGHLSQYLIDTLTGIESDLSEKKNEFQMIFTDEELKILDDDWRKLLKMLKNGKRQWSWFFAQRSSGI